MPLRFLLIVCLVFYGFAPLAGQQLGGSASFEFARLSPAARQVALGGSNITASLQDVNLFLENPGLLTDSLHARVSATHQFYYAGSHHSQLAGAFSTDTGTWGIGLQQIQYGSFDSYDNSGNFTGTFSARDFLLTVGRSYRSGSFSFGASLSFVQSSIENFDATGMLFDVGGVFIHPRKDLRAGITVNNTGFAFSYFTPGSEFTMPIDVRLGVSVKPRKMPLRLSVTMHRLHQLLDITYDNPALRQNNNAFGADEDAEPGLADKLSRHFIIGGEFVLGKNLNIRAGYNFLYRQELKLEQQGGLAGFSFGLMVRVKKIQIAYSRGIHHIAGGTDSFTVSVDTRTIFRKRRVVSQALPDKPALQAHHARASGQ